MRRPSLLLWSALLLPLACHDGEAPEPSAEASPPAESAAESEQDLDPRDQYALAHEIQQARVAYDDLEGTLARTRRAWIDRRYRWELAFVPALCRATGPCVALPFDHARDPARPIRQGWLPRLELDLPARAELGERCAGAGQCVIEVSGRLAQLELSTDKPPSLTLTEVEVEGTRSARPEERWIRGAARSAPRRG